MFFKNLEKYRIILGSQSPRRLELLSGTGIPFEVLVKNNGDEVFPPHLVPEEIPVYLARQKSRAYADIVQESNVMVITADTIVWIDGEVLGKPVDRADAKRMLNLLSDRWHLVITGVCISTSEKVHSFHTVTEVLFKSLSEHEIDYYVDLYEPFDKAGAYGIQEWIGYIGIHEIRGSYFNVMGLPVQRLCEALLTF